MRIRQTSIYSQKQVKCGEENIGMRKRICYHLGLRQQTIPEGLNRWPNKLKYIVFNI